MMTRITKEHLLLGYLIKYSTKKRIKCHSLFPREVKRQLYPEVMHKHLTHQ